MLNRRALLAGAAFATMFPPKLDKIRHEIKLNPTMTGPYLYSHQQEILDKFFESFEPFRIQLHMDRINYKYSTISIPNLSNPLLDISNVNFTDIGKEVNSIQNYHVLDESHMLFYPSTTSSLV